MAGEVGGVIKFGLAIPLGANQRVFLEPWAIATGRSTNLLHHVIYLTGEVIKGIQHGVQTGCRSYIDFRGQWASQKFGPSAPKIDVGSTSRLFIMLNALYNFTGQVNDVMKKVCGPSRCYRPWFKKYPLVCPQGNCAAEFDNASDFAGHLQQKHPNLPASLWRAP